MIYLILYFIYFFQVDFKDFAFGNATGPKVRPEGAPSHHHVNNLVLDNTPSNTTKIWPGTDVHLHYFYFLSTILFPNSFFHFKENLFNVKISFSFSFALVLFRDVKMYYLVSLSIFIFHGVLMTTKYSVIFNVN